MRKCSTGCGLSPTRDWILRSRFRIRTHRADDGVCDRAHLGLPSESSSLTWSRSRKTVPHRRIVSLCDRASSGSYRRSRGTVRDREWKSRIRPKRRFRIERLRFTFTRRVFSSSMLCRGSGLDLLFPYDHYGSNRPSRSCGLCTHRDWLGVDSDSFNRNPGHESLSKSCTEYGAGNLCWRMGDRPAVDVLDSPHHWRHSGRSTVLGNLRVMNWNGRD